MAFITQHKLLVILGAVVLAAAVWWGLSGTGTTEELVSSQPVEEGITVNNDIVATLLSLRTVKLEGTIFTDTAFMTLKDFSTQIVPEPVGRTNPFAPLTTSGPTTASSTHNAQIFTPRR